MARARVGGNSLADLSNDEFDGRLPLFRDGAAWCMQSVEQMNAALATAISSQIITMETNLEVN